MMINFSKLKRLMSTKCERQNIMVICYVFVNKIKLQFMKKKV